ncbi:MAG: glycosyltransferase [Actinobacteria bacterium]|nr:glycosyltransferase [Actinomycetota bacterium]
MNSIPKLSVGIPVYNGEEFLELALDSILDQTFTDFEVVISDNASTDRTEEICRSFIAKDDRIRYFRNEENLGASRNYNRVFELSRGEYFKWAAVDDLCAPDYFLRCVHILDSRPDVVVCYPRTKIIDQHGQVLEEYDDGLNLQSDSAFERFRQFVRTARECNAVFGVIRSSVLQRTRLIENYNGSDIILLAELSLYGKFYELADYLFFRRTHPQCSSNLQTPEETLVWFDPAQKGKFHFRTWKHSRGYFSSIRKAPLSTKEKMRLFVESLRYMYWKKSDLSAEIKQIFAFNRKTGHLQ